MATRKVEKKFEEKFSTRGIENVEKMSFCRFSDHQQPLEFHFPRGEPSVDALEERKRAAACKRRGFSRIVKSSLSRRLKKKFLRHWMPTMLLRGRTIIFCILRGSRRIETRFPWKYATAFSTVLDSWIVSLSAGTVVKLDKTIL